MYRCINERGIQQYLVIVPLFLCLLLLLCTPIGWADSSSEMELVLADDATSMENAGWKQRLAPVPGVYMIDSDLSLGNPNEVEVKPVPAGQYLFYGDERASALTQYTTLSKKLPIGAGAWSLEFSAKIVDLMRPSQHHIYRGISFEIFAAGKEYKITFNDENKVLAMTDFSSGYEEQIIEMPADDEFHDWGIAFDGKSTVTVSLDGNVVASFRNIGLDVAEREDELVILNAPLNWEAGMNEVYIDNISMYASRVEYIPSEILIDDDGFSLRDAGWRRTMDPIDGLYITDAQETLGNPNGIKMKAVEPGQYLFYGDERASELGRYVRMTYPLVIGNQAWTVEFSARFVDLITPSANSQDRGILFDIFADGKRYKLAFNDQDKIVTGTGIETQIAMPTDNEFHKWEFVYNGVDTVYVKLDDEIVASFDNLEVSGAGVSDQIRIANVPLNWVSGTNEVYFDYIKMYTMEPGDPNILIHDEADSFQMANWVVDSPEVNGYFTDYEQTNGTVAGMLPVEEGRYLTYANAQASTAVQVKQSVYLKDNPWALAFDIRIAELVKPNLEEERQGLRFEVVANGQKHQLTFNEGNQVYVSQANGNQINLQTELLSDHYYDQWGIAYDEHGRLMITQNGEKLALLTDTGIPTNEEDHVAIINDAVGAVGANKMYIDRIRLTKNLMPEWSEFLPLIDGVTILPTSDAHEMTAVVSLFDADPIQVEAGVFTIEAELTREGQVIERLTETITEPKTTLLMNPQGERGWMNLSLILKEGHQIKSDVEQKVEIRSKVTILQPSQTSQAVPDETVLYTDMEQVVGAVGQSLDEAGWQLAAFSYDGTTEEGMVLENTSEAAAAVQLPITLNGWYGVYVGYVTGTEGFELSTGTQTQEQLIEGVTTDEPYGQKGISEQFVLAENFHDGTLNLSAIPGKKARIAYVKFKGFSEDEIAVYVKPDEGEAGTRVIYNNDGYSDYFSGKYDTKHNLLENAVNFFEDQDVDSLYFALGTTLNILRNSEVAGRPYDSLTPEQEAELMRDGDQRVRDVILQYIDAGQDPLEIVAQRLNEIGVNAYASLRMSAFYSPDVYPWLNGNRYDEFVDKGYRILKENNSPDVRLSYAYPEFRQFIIDVLKEAAVLENDEGERLLTGVELDYCRYPYVLGYEEVLVDEYKARYGIDPRDDLSEEGQQRWYQLKAEVMTSFMEEVRAELAGQQISVRIPYDVYEENGLDIETWIEEDLIDRLVVCTIQRETFFDEIAYFSELTEGTSVEIYGNINGRLSGSDLTRREEDLMKRGIRLDRGGTSTSKQQYLLRALEFYEAGYDGIYIFNNWNGTTNGQSILGVLGDKVNVKKWYHLAYPAEWVQNLITVNEPRTITFVSVQQQLEQLIAAGDVEMPLTQQLRNSLRQALHHYEAGRIKQTKHHLERFLKHLHNEPLQEHITKDAAVQLEKMVNALLRQLQ